MDQELSHRVKKAKYCLDLILIPKNTIVLGNDRDHANFYYPKANGDDSQETQAKGQHLFTF